MSGRVHSDGLAPGAWGSCGRTRKKRMTMRPMAQREMMDPGSVASDKSLAKQVG